MSSLPAAIGNRIDLGITGGHGIQELISTEKNIRNKIETDFLNDQAQLDSYVRELKQDLSNCAAAE